MLQAINSPETGECYKLYGQIYIRLGPGRTRTDLDLDLDPIRIDPFRSVPSPVFLSSSSSSSSAQFDVHWHLRGGHVDPASFTFHAKLTPL